MNGRHRAESVGLVMALTAALSFGTLAISAKLAYDQGARPLPLLAIRFALTAMLLVMIARATRRPLLVGRPAATKLMLLGALGYGVEASLFFLALEHSPAGIVGLIFYSYPLWTNIIGLASGLERFRPRVVVALVLGTAGVSSIFTVSDTGLLGPLLALCSALAVAVYFVVAQIVTRGLDPATSAVWTAVGAACSVGIAALVAQHGLPAAALPYAGTLALATAVSFVLMYGAIARIGSARSSIAGMLEPITTVVLAAIFLSEALTIRVAIGAALVVSSLPVLASEQPRGDSPPSADSA